jgi:haloalkane dehalogenase
MTDYTYARHVDWLHQWLTKMDLRDLTLVCQDWGGLIGLRVAADQIGRFKRIVVANTGLPSTAMISDEMSAFLGQMYPAVPVPDAGMVREQFQSGGLGQVCKRVAILLCARSVRDAVGRNRRAYP